MKKLFAPGNDSFLTSLGLLVLRLFFGGTMLLHHGVDKLMKFGDMHSSFPDPMGFGHTTSAVLTLFAEVVAAALLAAGLLTRFAALVLAFEMAVAFIMVHKMTLGGAMPGELAFIYFGAYVTLLIAGGGAISVDKVLFGKSGWGQSK
jgi:putative oxidoreductase